MVKNSLMLNMAASALVLLAGCGSASKTTSSSTQAASSSAAPAASGGAYGHSTTTSASSTAASATNGVLITSKHEKVGTILAAGPKKLTVYMFEGDKGSTSSCSGACAAAWPPVTSAAAAKAASGARAADLGTITRSDGTKQVTYKGHPLYFFSKDKDDGDAYGQGLKAFGASWYVLQPSGSKIDES
jgi:predicted lipoprotein with Yx(FWY)xxD motif